MTNENSPFLQAQAEDLQAAQDDHLAALAQQVAAELAPPNGNTEQPVDQILRELGDRLMVRALADEGITQRPPVALLIWGHENEPDENNDDFYAGYLDARDQLTLGGNIVLEHEFMAAARDLMDLGDLQMMQQLLFHKVDMADVVNVFNPGGQLDDEDTVAAIAYANQAGKPVQYTIPPAE